MKHLLRLFTLIALSSTLSYAAEGWSTDFEAASKQAKEQGKYMLLDFSGSDWCSWCIKLNNEVFSQSSFQEYAKENLVTVKLDFPRRKKIPEETREQNKQLAKEYKVRGYPTVIILSPEGELVERTGFRPGGSDEYVSHIKGIIASHQK